MKASDVLVLPADVALQPVALLDAHLRQRLDCESDDCVVSRPRHREQALIIGADAAHFLRQFRAPMTVVAAVLASSAQTGSAPEQLLTEILPLVARARRLRFLVARGSAEAAEVRARLAPGARIAGLRIRRCVHLLDDVEVYETALADGSGCALKLLRRRAGREAVLGLERERRVLERLAGRGAPRLVAYGAWRGCGYLVLAWCGTRDVEQVAAQLRAASGPLTAPVLALCNAVLRAYAALHAAGLLHADVHPRNLLVQDDGSVVLIDFAASLTIQPRGGLPFRVRRGLSEYLEPECARALERGARPPAPTPASEQYALAALCYYLATGAPYLDVALVRERWYAQVQREPPRPWRALGLAGGTALERVLRIALSKHPQDRHPSTAAFARRFERAAASAPRARKPHADSGDFLAGVTARYGLSDGEIDHAVCEPPRCSISYGASGIAYFYYRLATLGGDPALLATAAAWSRWARTHARSPDAGHNAAIGLGAEAIGPVSLYHRRTGILLVHALIAHASGDFAECAEAVAAFVEAASEPSPELDLTVGQSGLLLGCAVLLESLPARAPIDRRKLERIGRQLARRLETALAAGGLAAPAPFPWLGVAHGWAGALFAALRWRQATGSAVAGVRERLSDLAALAQRSRSAARWPVCAGARGEDATARTGWCHGSAGYLQLWALADQVYPRAGFDRLASGAAEHLCRAGARDAINGSLCCGYAGQGFAMLTLYRRDGNRRWLEQARTFLARAIVAAPAAERRASLYKGDAGIALLAAELEHPARSRMPLFEAEGWPRRL